MPVHRTLAACVLVLVLGSTFSGSLGDPTPGGFIRFDDIRRASFSALAVQRHHDGPEGGVLAVRVNVMGDAENADISEASDWLERELGVRIVRDPRGVPLYLTNHNLIAVSGAGAIGATVRSGMAVEMLDARLAPCVVAHEVLHFLGLHHVSDKANIMYARCSAGKLSEAALEDWQREHVASLKSVVAVTPGGIVTWAVRSPPPPS